MRFKINLYANQIIELPLSYHHQVQSLLYSLLSGNEEISSRVHDGEKGMDRKNYKMFTFSNIVGKFKIEQKTIKFLPPISIEVSTIDDEIYKALIGGLATCSKLKLVGQELTVKSVEFFNKKLTKSSYQIKMQSPITCHISNGNQTQYFSPIEKQFEEALVGNFQRKYKAYYGQEPDFSFSLTPINFSLKNKVVTSYKDFYITGWKGEYLIEGDPRALDFLYQVGIGEKNSMGFGMFKIIKGGKE